MLPVTWHREKKMEPVATDNVTVDARIDLKKKVLAIKQKKESPKTLLL